MLNCLIIGFQVFVTDSKNGMFLSFSYAVIACSADFESQSMTIMLNLGIKLKVCFKLILIALISP